MKLTKIFAILALTMFIGHSAFATLQPTVTSRQRYEAQDGTTYERVIGTLAFDSTYPGNSTTLIYGEALPPTILGLASIRKMNIEPTYAQNVGVTGGTIFFKYSATECTQNPLGGCLYGSNVRAFYSRATATSTGVTDAPLVSLPSYDLSALTAVPFEAVGPVL